MIHPALAAALTPEKIEAQTLPEQEPISRVEYRSRPLHGTEERDRIALGLEPNPKPTTLGLAVPEKTGDTFGKGNPEFGSAFSSAGHMLKRTTRLPQRQSLSPQRRSNVIPGGSHTHVVENTPRGGEFHPGAAGYPRRIENPQQIAPHSKPDSVTGKADSNDNSSTSGFWQSLVAKILDTLGKRTGPVESTTVSGKNELIVADGVYTTQDVEDMVSDIIRSIQLRTEEAQAHEDVLENAKRWSPEDETMNNNKALDREAPLVVQRKAYIDPQILVEELSNSAQKFISAKRPALSSDRTYQFLLAVQVRLAELLKSRLRL